jgi:uncharacterized protein YlxW (UPF0749 family)
MHKVEDRLGDLRFWRIVRWCFGVPVVIIAVKLYSERAAIEDREVARRVDLLYTTMQPQVEETERLQKIKETQKTIDECVRKRDMAQKTIDDRTKALQQLMKENEGK